MNKDEILHWLRETDANQLKTLWQKADLVRRQHVGDEVHLRGLLEISNYCVRRCTYCGLNVTNKKLERYRMSAEEMMECVRKVASLGYGTVVMQSGEDYGIATEDMVRMIQRIKSETSLAVTLSLGERPLEDIKRWRQAGADRYLLRFETSDSKLYQIIHPPLQSNESPHHRLNLLRQIKSLGYEVGSGVMIGIPGQSYESLAQDIGHFMTLDLDMIGVGPYIENPRTTLVTEALKQKLYLNEDQVPNGELMVYKVIALARLVCPEANIPSTTALATINRASGRELGLMRGANIVMPNVTPVAFREKYEIYPGKACINETADICNSCIRGRIKSIGRVIGKGPGNRKHHG